jgi:uncharacterized membrane protein YwzB
MLHDIIIIIIAVPVIVLAVCIGILYWAAGTVAEIDDIVKEGMD